MYIPIAKFNVFSMLKLVVFMLFLWKFLERDGHALQELVVHDR